MTNIYAVKDTFLKPPQMIFGLVLRKELQIFTFTVSGVWVQFVAGSTASLQFPFEIAPAGPDGPNLTADLSLGVEEHGAAALVLPSALMTHDALTAGLRFGVKGFILTALSIGDIRQSVVAASLVGLAVQLGAAVLEDLVIDALSVLEFINGATTAALGVRVVFFSLVAD